MVSSVDDLLSFQYIPPITIEHPEQYKDTKKLPASVAILLHTRYPEWVKATGELTPYGQRSIVSLIESYNYNEHYKSRAAQEKIFLKRAQKKYASVIAGIHKRRELHFNKTAPGVGFPQVNILLHKSTSYNKRQSSEYRLGLMHNDLAYFRKSDHWGAFTTQIHDLQEAMAEFGITLEEAKLWQQKDPFGRIGSKRLTWSLEGGRAQGSQIGYILFKDLV
jgi:hypothetical protein